MVVLIKSLKGYSKLSVVLELFSSNIRCSK